MKWFHRRRLERLADKLEGKGLYVKVGPVPPEKFDMLHLFSLRRWTGKETNRDGFNPERCETAACALGWAMVDPWFTERRIGNTYTSSVNFFGLSGKAYGHLFYASQYRGFGGRRAKPEVVAARLREAAKEG